MQAYTREGSCSATNPPRLRAIGTGIGAAILGAALYYVVLALTGYEIGLVAIVVGFLVGRAVRWGSGGRGGAFYQAIAVGLTYVAIVSTYVPFIVQGLNEAEQAQPVQQTTLADPTSTGEELPLRDDPSGAAAEDEASSPSGRQLVFILAVFALFVLASPLLAGFQNIIGWVIIGLALYEAWRVNRRLLVEVTGPYALGQ